MAERARLLPLVGAYNFRDLGGYPTTSGRETRWGRLYRSDTLHELTTEDVAVLRDLGLASILDLRMAGEIDRAGRGPLSEEPIRYTHLSVISEGSEDRAAPSGPSKSERYLWYLEVGRQALVDAFTLLSEEANYPTVFHCFAGKDRTGVLAAMVLSALGVDRETIVEDYLLTATRMDLIAARIQRDPAYAGLKISAAALAVEADTMEGFLDGMEERHGGTRTWLADAGVSKEQLDALEAILLVDPSSSSDPS